MMVEAKGSTMKAKQVVDLAKSHLLEVTSGEPIEDVSLEEIWFEEKKGLWKVTLGVRRKSPPNTPLSQLGLSLLPTYKIVTISDGNQRVVSLRDRSRDAISG